MTTFLPLEVPEDLIDVISDLIVYEEEKQKDLEEIEEELERAYAELEIDYPKPDEEKEAKIDFSFI